MSNIKQINDTQFEFHQIPSARALKLSVRVAKAVGPMIEKLGNLKNLKGLKTDADIPPELLNVIGEIAANLDENELEYLRKEFADFCSFVDEQGNTKVLKNAAFFEECFKGNVIFMLTWMWHFIKANFLNGLSS